MYLLLVLFLFNFFYVSLRLFPNDKEPKRIIKSVECQCLPTVVWFETNNNNLK